MHKLRKESDVWSAVRLALIGMGAGMHYNRIETHSTALGFPDVEYCWRGVLGHIELKFVKNISDVINIRPSQIMWFTERVKAGGNPIMITGISRTKGICGMEMEQIIMLHYGCDVAKMTKMTAKQALNTAKCIWYDEIDVTELNKEIAAPWYQHNEIYEEGGYR